ncbi:MAG: imidazoleglycerol-phosphate dehydratase HisB [Dehalococcoidales bacterium]|nr:imidazoleglycerol-phosphate dehydratase HisB [Dehalococcoidales bacterium]
MSGRKASVTRKTKETSVTVELNIDGSGRAHINTGIGFLDHLLEQLARHGLFDLSVQARGDTHVDPHHTVEDVGISLGLAFDKALGDRRGIVRMAHAIVPLDESLSCVALDISGRGYAVVDLPFTSPTIGELPATLISHFIESLASQAHINIHVRLLSGLDDHHKAEATFKALARALDDATKIDERRIGEVPSTKGIIAGPLQEVEKLERID